MNNEQVSESNSSVSAKPAWGAVFAMSVGGTVLTIAQILPISLLTPLAKDLGITEGMAGQAVTIHAAAALISSLLTPSVTSRLDRRMVLLSFSFLLVGSNVLVFFAPNLTVLLLARVMLGVAHGGFWGMSAATTMRLVPEELVQRALSIVLGGLSLATIVAGPLGSYLGDIIGWRNVFLAAAVFGMLALIWQSVTFPPMEPDSQTRLSTLRQVLKHPLMKPGIIAVVLAFTGHFGFYTYLRPFIETLPGIGIKGLSTILLVFGITNFAGTLLMGYIPEQKLRHVLIAMPLLMSMLAAGFVAFSSGLVLSVVFIGLWGVASGAVQTGWSTWVARTVPDEAESGGGLLVAAVQLAIAMGAAVGGLIFDTSGIKGVFSGSGILLFISAVVITFGIKTTRRKNFSSQP